MVWTATTRRTRLLRGVHAPSWTRAAAMPRSTCSPTANSSAAMRPASLTCRRGSTRMRCPSCVAA